MLVKLVCLIMGGWIVVMIMDDDVNNVIFMDTLREAFKKKTTKHMEFSICFVVFFLKASFRQ